MRITIIPQDNKVVIDGESYDGIDLSSIDSNINAIQWYGTEGELEVKDGRGRIVENRDIATFDDFSFVLPLWEDAKLKAKEKVKVEPTL